MYSRRVFLKNGAFAFVSLGFAPSFMARTAVAATGRSKRLIAIFQRGAVDGLQPLLGGALSETTRATIAKATDGPKMMALTFGAPEFQRR